MSAREMARPAMKEGCSILMIWGIRGRRADLDGNTNSTVWAIAHNPAVPNLIIAYSIAGQVFSSIDNGDSWTKFSREFGEVRAVAIAQ